MSEKIKYAILHLMLPFVCGTLLGVYLELEKKVCNIPLPINILISALLTFLLFFFIDWLEFKAVFNSFENEFNNKIKTLNNIASLLEEFFEANIIIDNLIKSIKSDLVFNKQIKESKQTCELDFHVYLSKLKYEDYFNSHFLFCADDKSIKKIPKKYFENSIWTMLIDNSRHYLSTQIFDNKTKALYLIGQKRRDHEITRINLKINQKQLLIFNKLFIVQDDMIDMVNKKFLDNDLKAYINGWFTSIRLSKDVQIKIIQYSKANGALGEESVKDMGIFDKIIAFQELDKNVDSITINKHNGTSIIDCERSFTFDFNLNSAVINDYRKNFIAIFNDAESLGRFFA